MAAFALSSHVSTGYWAAQKNSITDHQQMDLIAQMSSLWLCYFILGFVTNAGTLQLSLTWVAYTQGKLHFSKLAKWVTLWSHNWQVLHQGRKSSRAEFHHIYKADKNQTALFKSRKQSLGIWPVNPPVMCEPGSANMRCTRESVRAKTSSKSAR